MRSDYLLSQLDVLEAESIHIMREVAAEFERPALLFSGGKDSTVLLRIAEKAFRPGRFVRSHTPGDRHRWRRGHWRRIPVRGAYGADPAYDLGGE